MIRNCASFATLNIPFVILFPIVALNIPLVILNTAKNLKIPFVVLKRKPEESLKAFITNSNLSLSQKEKGFIPSILPLAPKRIKLPLFLIQGESLAFSASSSNRAEALLPPLSTISAQ